eukprot:3471977-Prorocentrum_lima.AAC.1
MWEHVPLQARLLALRVSLAPLGRWSSGKRKCEAPLSPIANGSDCSAINALCNALSNMDSKPVL